MSESFFDRVHKNDTLHSPDVLSCLANLSNDEVFTPPEVVNQMLDMLPQDLFSDPSTKFLDPACKTGVFLREIAKRLLVGLETLIPNLEERIEHIYKKQLYGIAITELTSLLSRRSLYCSKYPNGEYSICRFDNPEGNIRFKRIQHTWGKKYTDVYGKSEVRCIYCGGSKEKYDRGEKYDTYAYEFIHDENIKEILKMNFDVVISNPPYQLTIGTQSEKYAIPIYQKFIGQAKKLNPRYLTMIIPAKWYTGGRGLDDFRNEMLNDDRIRKIVDYPNPYDCFQGVDNPGGICYFLWDREHRGDCEFTTKIGDIEYRTTRVLNEYSMFVRDAKGLEIIKHINKTCKTNKRLSDVVSPQTPFGIISSYEPRKKGIVCWYKQKIGKQYVDPKDVRDNLGIINKYKLLIPKAPIAGQTDFTKPVGLYYDGNMRIAMPGEICNQSWLVAGSFDSEKEVKYYKSYILTKIVRFLILQAVVSQDVSREKFCFVPSLEHYDQEYTDEILRKKWSISDDQYEYIVSRVGEISGNNNQ